MGTSRERICKRVTTLLEMVERIGNLDDEFFVLSFEIVLFQ